MVKLTKSADGLKLQPLQSLEVDRYDIQDGFYLSVNNEVIDKGVITDIWLGSIRCMNQYKVAEIDGEDKDSDYVISFLKDSFLYLKKLGAIYLGVCKSITDEF